MKSIILAAGRGTRIPQFSKKKPKCMIQINGKSILKRQIDFFNKLRIEEIVIVRGYKKNFLKIKNIKYIDNEKFKTSEQLESLNCAKGELNGQLIISFSDIIYDFKILKKIILSKNDKITLAIDKNWKKRYKNRYDHPYEQADKVKLNKKDEVKKIGKEISIDDADAEFLGILKINNSGAKIFKEYFKKLNKSEIKKMQIHHFINYLSKKNVRINTCSVFGKYMEIDTYNDYKISKKMFKK